MKKYIIIFVIIMIAMVPLIGKADEPPRFDDNELSGPPIDNELNTKPKIFTTLQNPLKAKSVTEVLVATVNLAIVIGVVVAVLMFIFIGFKFVLAQGDPAKLKEARSWFFYAVIGTAVLISAKLIVEVVQNTLISAGVVKENQFKPLK